jgi:predicted metal-dependent phosphoesterase TrpH
MRSYCDLHTHSIYSDGTYTPTELIAEAEKIGLSAVALTDHNTVVGVPEFLQAAQGKRIEGVAGVEFSTDYGETELHVNALFVKPQYFSQVDEWVSVMAKNKEESNIRLADNLRKAGYDIRYEEVVGDTPRGHVNRVHFASALVRKGYVASIEDAFKKLLAKDGGFYQQPKRLDVFETIGFIKDIGAVSVLAHSFLNLSEQELIALRDKAVPCGLKGLETMYYSYNERTEARARAIAKAYGICESGGSDFHGARRPGVELGIGKGNLKIPAEFFQRLKEELR